MTVSEETKNYVTPYAFTVSDSLLGRPLASPKKRAVAITLDLIFISLIATLSGLILVAAVGVLSLLQGYKALVNRKRVGQALALFSVSAVCLLVLGLGIYFSQPEEAVQEKEVPVTELAGDRWFGSDTTVEPEASNQSESTGLVTWLQGSVSNLGQGFGWAAMYFTLFVAWMDGQTPGKKLLGTQVIRIDGKPLGLWDSFGRYGGYVAGFSTGLLGFLQVYWDHNRQAIHDKIAETMVVDLRKPSLAFDRTTTPLNKADSDA